MHLLAASSDGIEAVVKTLTAAAAPRSEPMSKRFAAVLVPLFQDAQGRVRVLLTQRSAKLTTHRGEVCLPGGKRDPVDGDDDVATALREAHEELGLLPSDAVVLCQLRPFLSKHYLSVTPVVARVPDTFVATPNPDEVAAVFSMPLAAFLSADNHTSEDVTWHDYTYRLHYFDYEGFNVWGLTAAMMISVAQQALGRPPAFQEHCDHGHDYRRLYHDGERLRMRSVSPPEPEVTLLAPSEEADAAAAGAAAAAADAEAAAPHAGVSCLGERGEEEEEEPAARAS